MMRLSPTLLLSTWTLEAKPRLHWIVVKRKESSVFCIHRDRSVVNAAIFLVCLLRHGPEAKSRMQPSAKALMNSESSGCTFLRVKHFGHCALRRASRSGLVAEAKKTSDGGGKLPYSLLADSSRRIPARSAPNSFSLKVLTVTAFALRSQCIRSTSSTSIGRERSKTLLHACKEGLPKSSLMLPTTIEIIGG